MNIKPCVKCGSIERNASGQCKICQAAKNFKYRLENKEKCDSEIAKWRAANRDRIKKTNAAWRAANPNKSAENSAAWSAKNKEYKALMAASYRAANKEKLIAYRMANKEHRAKINAIWHLANPSARRIYERNRNARKRKMGGNLSKGLAEKLLKLQRGMCICCRKLLKNDYHLDHKMPLVLGGSNTDNNIQLLCPICNQQKHAKHPIDFMQSRGFLI